MKLKIVCDCGNQELVEINSDTRGVLNNFVLWSNYDDDKVFLECDECNKVVQISIV